MESLTLTNFIFFATVLVLDQQTEEHMSDQDKINEPDLEDEIAKVMENPKFFSRKRTDWLARVLDKARWPLTWPLGNTAFARVLLSIDTPSKITFWGLLLAFLMIACFMVGTPDAMILGKVFYSVSMITDFWDGTLSRYQDFLYPKLIKYTEDGEYALSFWKRICLKGSTHFGTIFDALKDKLVYQPALFMLGWNTISHGWWLWPGLTIAILLTIIRIRKIRNWITIKGKNSSKWPGKIKVNIEVAAIAALGLIPTSGVFQFDRIGIHLQIDQPVFRYYAANFCAGVAVAFAAWSLATHLWLGFRTARTKQKERKLAQSLR